MTAPGLTPSYPVTPGAIPPPVLGSAPSYYVEDHGDPAFNGQTVIFPRGGASAAPSYPPMIYLPFPATAPADGQIFSWSAALGSVVPVNPSGAAELAAAVNNTGVTTVFTATNGVGTAVDILGCTITVPVSTRPVWLEYGIQTYVITPGPGSMYLEVNETTGGGNTNVHNCIQPMAERSGSNDASQAVLSMDSRYRLGPVASPRIFKLTLVMYAATGTATAQALNQGTGVSYITAVAR